MLSNAYFLAKFRFDTAENEPAKNLQNLSRAVDAARRYATGDRGRLLPDGLLILGRADFTVNIRGFKVAGGWLKLWAGGRPKLARLAFFFQIFGGLVLGCIKTKFCKCIL